MAGCRPEYFPVVVAALEAMFDAAFNLHTVLTSTGGAALCARRQRADRAGDRDERAPQLPRPGNRANATIGRALRLVGDERARLPAGRARRVVVRPPRQVHALLRRGPAAGAVAAAARASSATRPATRPSPCCRSRAPHQLAQQLNERAEDDPALVRRRDPQPDAGSRPARAARRCSCSAPSTPASASRRAGRRRRCASSSTARARIAPAELIAAGVADRGRRRQHDMTPGEDGKLASRAHRPTTCARHRGRRGRRLVGLMPAVGADDPRPRARSRRVRPAGEPLPDCGPDGCIVPWLKQTA